MKPAIAIFSALLFFTTAFAQPKYVFTRNSPANSATATAIELKWLCKELVSSDGFNIYRRQGAAGPWVLLEASPVKKLPTLATPLLQADEELAFLVEVVNEASAADLQEDFLLLNLVLKSFQSNEFARFLGIYFADSTAIAGQEYQYRVTRLVGATTGATEEEIGISDKITAGPFAKTLPVKGVEVFQNGKELAINWEQDERRFYAVNIFQQDSAGTSTPLNKRPLMLSMVSDSTGAMVYPKPMYKRRGLTEGSSYTFYLEGVDYFGESTLPSEPRHLTVDDITPPPPPHEVQGRADSLRILLRWKQQPTPDLMGFHIYRSPRSTGPFEKTSERMASPADTVYREVLSIPGPSYYQVEAVDHSGNASRSALAFVDVQDVIPPAAPRGLAIQADTGRFHLRWQANTEPDLLGYYLFRTINADGPGDYLLLNADALDTNYYEQVLPATVRNQFFYYLVAVDTSYNRSRPSALATATLPDATPPEQPAIRQVLYTVEGIVVEWASNVEADLLGYHLHRADSAPGAAFARVNEGILGPATYRYTDRVAAPNTEYLYRLTAIDSAGNHSEPSGPAYALRYVEHQLDEALGLKIRARKGKKAVRLSWAPLTSPEVRGYVVYRGVGENTLRPLSGLITAEAAYEDGSLEDNTYVYQVRAYTLSGQVIYSSKTEWRAR